MRQNRITSIITSLLAMMFFLAGCSGSNGSSEQSLPVSQTYFIFDTVVTLRVYDERMGDKQFAEVKALLETIDRQMNRMAEGSEIDQVNKQSGVAPVPVSEDTFKVVKTALDYARISDGRFDPTVGPLVDLWGIGTEHAAVPSDANIQAALNKIDYHKVTLDEKARTVFLTDKGMSIDLGAIAKGYAADVINHDLTHQDIHSAIIDLGGNIIAMGSKPDGNAWSIGVQDPAEQRGEHLGILKVTNKTIVTSGVYERYFKKDGALYHHILNTRDGYPVHNNLLSVTIITDASMDADALSTTTFAMELDEGRRFIESRGDAEAIFVTKDKLVYLTSGLLGKFELTNGGYKLAE